MPEKTQIEIEELTDYLKGIIEKYEELNGIIKHLDDDNLKFHKKIGELEKRIDALENNESLNSKISQLDFELTELSDYLRGF